MIRGEVDDTKSLQRLKWLNAVSSRGPLYGLGDDDAAWAAGQNRFSSMRLLIGQIQAAFGRAKAIVDSPPFGTDEGVLSGWKTNLRLVEGGVLPNGLRIVGILDRLQDGDAIDRATNDDSYFRKWVDTAKAALSGLEFIAFDVQGQGLINAIKYALNSIPITLAPFFDLKNILLVGGGLLALYVVARGVGAGRRARTA